MLGTPPARTALTPDEPEDPDPEPCPAPPAGTADIGAGQTPPAPPCGERSGRRRKPPVSPPPPADPSHRETLGPGRTGADSPPAPPAPPAPGEPGTPSTAGTTVLADGGPQRGHQPVPDHGDDHVIDQGLHDGTGHRRHHVAHGTHPPPDHVRHDRLHDATRHRAPPPHERRAPPATTPPPPPRKRDVGNHRGSNVTEEGQPRRPPSGHHVTDQGARRHRGRWAPPHPSRAGHATSWTHLDRAPPRLPANKATSATGPVTSAITWGDPSVTASVGRRGRPGGQRAYRLMRLRAHNVGGGRRCGSTDERHGHWAGLGRRRGRGRRGWRGAKRRCGDVGDRTVGRWGGQWGGEFSDCGVGRLTRKSVGDGLDDGPDGGSGGWGFGPRRGGRRGAVERAGLRTQGG